MNVLLRPFPSQIHFRNRRGGKVWKILLYNSKYLAKSRKIKVQNTHFQFLHQHPMSEIRELFQFHNVFGCKLPYMYFSLTWQLSLVQLHLGQELCNWPSLWLLWKKIKINWCNFFFKFSNKQLQEFLLRTYPQHPFLNVYKLTNHKQTYRYRLKHIWNGSKVSIQNLEMKIRYLIFNFFIGTISQAKISFRSLF